MEATIKQVRDTHVAVALSKVLIERLNRLEELVNEDEGYQIFSPEVIAALQVLCKEANKTIFEPLKIAPVDGTDLTELAFLYMGHTVSVIPQKEQMLWVEEFEHYVEIAYADVLEM